MKVTSQDIRNLAEALAILQKHMYLHTGTITDLVVCIDMAVQDFKERLLYEGLDEDEKDEEEGEEEDAENDD